MLANISSSLELYRLIVEKDHASDLPIVLTHKISKEQQLLLQSAGLIHGGVIAGLQLYFADAIFSHQPRELMQRLIDHNPDLFGSLVDECIGQGQILVAQSLHCMKDAEISLIKLMLRYAKDRLHLIDLP